MQKFFKSYVFNELTPIIDHHWKSGKIYYKIIRSDGIHDWVSSDFGALIDFTFIDIASRII